MISTKGEMKMTNMITMTAPKSAQITTEGLETLLMCVEESLDLDTLLRQFETTIVDRSLATEATV